MVEFYLSTREMLQYLVDGIASGQFDMENRFHESLNDEPIRIDDVSTIDITFTLKVKELIDLIINPNEVTHYVGVSKVVINSSTDTIINTDRRK